MSKKNIYYFEQDVYLVAIVLQSVRWLLFEIKG